MVQLRSGCRVSRSSLLRDWMEFMLDWATDVKEFSNVFHLDSRVSFFFLWDFIRLFVHDGLCMLDDGLTKRKQLFSVWFASGLTRKSRISQLTLTFWNTRKRSSTFIPIRFCNHRPCLGLFVWDGPEEGVESHWNNHTLTHSIQILLESDWREKKNTRHGNSE